MTAPESSTVYVYNLNPRTTANDLSDLFEAYGRLSNIQLNNNMATIVFDDHRDATDAINGINGRNLDDYRLNVTRTPKNFVSFQQIAQMMQNDQIQSWMIDPTVNINLKFVGKNGATYLVKARYDQTTNQILPPV
jgi:RNA recognition motif-containing protein